MKWTPRKHQDCPNCGNEMYFDGGTGQSCGACGEWVLWFPLPSKARRRQRRKNWGKVQGAAH